MPAIFRQVENPHLNAVCTKRSELRKRNQAGAPCLRESLLAAATEGPGKMRLNGNTVWFSVSQPVIRKWGSNMDLIVA